MPNLFPITNEDVPLASTPPAASVKFGRSFRFDFGAGDFVTTPTGSVAEAGGADAWVEWCKKAIRTERYRYLIYSRNYGQEFDDLIARHLTRTANESEIRRTTTETLQVDKRTASVGNFVFSWEDSRCSFSCEVTNVLGEQATIDGSVVIG